MNQEQFLSLLRSLLLMAGPYLVAKGYTDDAGLLQLTAIATTLATVFWGVYIRREEGLIATANAMPDEAKASVAVTLPDATKIAIAAAVPDVAQIVTTPEKANADPSPKVVSQ